MCSVKSKTVSWFVSIKESRTLTRDELEDNGEEPEDDADYEFGLNSLTSAMPATKQLVLVCPKNTLVLRTNLFAWDYPWLRIRIEISSCGGNVANSVQKGWFLPVEYYLNDSQGVQATALFLKSVIDETKAAEQAEKDNNALHDLNNFKDHFLEYIKTLAVEEVKLSMFPKLLKDYEECTESSGSSFINIIHSTNAGCLLQTALDTPHFFKFSSLLFPRKVKAMAFQPDDTCEVKEDKKHLHCVLNDLIEQTPWKVGFSSLIYGASKTPRRGWSGLEANFTRITKAPFYRHFSHIEKDALHVYDMIKDICRRDGHTYITEQNLENYFCYTKDRKYERRVSNFYPPLCFMVDQGILHRDIKVPDERYHLFRYWKAEENICQAFKSLLTGYELTLDVDFSEERFSLINEDCMQRLAAKKICTNAITLISGRGGTGKTEVVSAVLSAADELLRKVDQAPHVAKKDPEGSSDEHSSLSEDDAVEQREEKDQGEAILYVAPTGKAAAVIRKRAGHPAFTAHQVLFSYKMWKCGKNGDKSIPWKFSSTKVMAVDECSMMSIELFSSLLNCLLQASHLQKIVLLGDVQQLPSIDPGNLMEDIFLALEPAGYTVKLVTNHRSEGSLIFLNALRISQKWDPIFDSARGFELVVPSFEELATLPPEIKVGASYLPPVLKASDRVLFHKTPLPKKVAKSKQELYLSLLRNHKDKYSLSDPRTSQIIAFKRSECEMVNEICCQVYNHHDMMGFDKDRSSRKTVQFFVGDKIMCTKNSDVPVYIFNEDSDNVKNFSDSTEQGMLSQLSLPMFVAGQMRKQDTKLRTEITRLMNGSVYMIENAEESDSLTKIGGKKDAAIDLATVDKELNPSDLTATDRIKEKVKYFVLDDLGGDVLRPNEKAFRVCCKPSHAWALTIHKFQGSESDTIVYGVSDSKNETWKHVYTAITRGKKRVIIVGSWTDLRNAVKRSPRPRQTTLNEKIRRLLKVVAMEKEAVENKSKAADVMTPKRQRHIEEYFSREIDDSFDTCLSQMSDVELNNFTKQQLVTPPKRPREVTDEKTPSSISPLSKRFDNNLSFSKYS